MVSHDPANTERIDVNFHPDYNVDQDKLVEIERKLVEDARQVDSEGVVVAWIDPAHEYSNFLRTKEAGHFPEVAETDAYYEFNQTYLAIVDTRGEGGVTHAATINFYDDSSDSQRTGFYTIDSLIERGNFTKEDFKAFYESRGINLNTTISIETNFKIDADMPPYEGLGSADLAYLAVFQWILARGWDHDGITLFATINEKQIASLERVGIPSYPLMDRSDFRTEEEELGKFSMPVSIDFQKGGQLMAALEMQLPEITYS